MLETWEYVGIVLIFALALASVAWSLRPLPDITPETEDEP